MAMAMAVATPPASSRAAGQRPAQLRAARLVMRHARSPRMLLRLFVVASLVMGASHTITKERIFEPVRRRLDHGTWIGYLLSCPYCTSHWVALLVVPLTDAYFVEVTAMPQPLRAAVRWLLSAIFVSTVAAYLRVVFYAVDVAQGVLRRLERIEDAELRARQ
jgi:hypothetical protein